MCVVETREHVERSLADGPTRILLLDNESFSLSLHLSLFVLPPSSQSKSPEELATLNLNFNVYFPRRSSSPCLSRLSCLSDASPSNNRRLCSIL